MACRVSENAPEISACDAMIAAAVARPTSGSNAHPGVSSKKGSSVRRRVEQQRALPEVVQEQRGQDDRKPGDTNGSRTEVSHVRVERFAAGDDEKDRAEHGEAVAAVLDRKNAIAVQRIQRREHLGVSRDPG